MLKKSQEFWSTLLQVMFALITQLTPLHTKQHISMSLNPIGISHSPCIDKLLLRKSLLILVNRLSNQINFNFYTTFSSSLVAI